MGLTNAWVQPFGKLPKLFERIRDSQAPPRVTIQLLKDWGFTASSDRKFISLLKAIGFLTDDGKPTQRYNDYRDHSRSRTVLGKAIQEAYADIFLIKANPTKNDHQVIVGKFKSYHNVSDNVASYMSKTFIALLELADLSASTESEAEGTTETHKSKETKKEHGGSTSTETGNGSVDLGLHYNIQIHLPPTKDVEVYNAIFKSIKEHLIEK